MVCVCVFDKCSRLAPKGEGRGGGFVDENRRVMKTLLN